MAAPAVLKGAGALSRGAQVVTALQGRCLLSELDALREREARAPPAQSRPVEAEGTQQPRQSFTLHIGADLHLPVVSTPPAPATPAPQAAAAEAEVRKDPFEGLPLRAWAENLGEKLMPALEVLREEQRRAKMAEKAGAKEPKPLSVPSIPHLLPFTRWAASSKVMQDTFIVEDAKNRKRARLSWYNPYDGIVPSGWLSEGLLKDLQYYAPFSRTPAK